MFERILARRRLRAAAKFYARRLGPQLIRDYGASEHYTPAQIQASVARAKLPAAHIDLGYAAFLSEEAFEKVAQPSSIGQYEAFRRMHAALKPSRPVPWGENPGGVAYPYAGGSDFSVPPGHH
jgi:hypothetical protein